MSADTTHSDTDLELARLGRVVRELREEGGLSMEGLAANCKMRAMAPHADRSRNPPWPELPRAVQARGWAGFRLDVL